jgi:hypothetical protein
MSHSAAPPPIAANQHALGEQVPHDARSARAHGESNGDLSLPRRSACEQQPRDIGGHHDQHQQHDDAERGARGGDREIDDGMNPDGARVECGEATHCVGGWILGSEARHQRLQRGSGGGGCLARREAPFDEQPAVASPVEP